MTRDDRGSSQVASSVTLSAAFLVVACAARSGSGPAVDQPAVLAAPTADTRAELARAVSEAMNGEPVRLADDALTTDAHLVITRAQRRDPGGRPIFGRSTEKPERFELVLRSGSCILIQERTGRRWRLPSARCSPSLDK
jgi:hypothetical protein